MQSFESELRDSTEYYMWQTEMRDRDAAIRKEQVQHSTAQHIQKVKFSSTGQERESIRVWGAYTFDS